MRPTFSLFSYFCVLSFSPDQLTTNAAACRPIYSLVLCSFTFLYQFPFAHRFTSLYQTALCLAVADCLLRLAAASRLLAIASHLSQYLRLASFNIFSRPVLALFGIAASRPQELFRNSPLGRSDLASDTANVLPTSRWSKGKRVALRKFFKISKITPNVAFVSSSRVSGPIPTLRCRRILSAERTTISTIGDIVVLSAFLSVTK